MSELTFEQFRDKLLRWSVNMPQAAKKALTEAAETVRREAQESHLSGPRMPRGVGHDTQATLAVRTGRLRRSIAIEVNVKPGEVSATVGTNVSYGRYHEEGRKWHQASRGQLSQGGRFAKAKMSRRRMATASMVLIGDHDVTLPERPFLRPSLNKKHTEIFEKLRVRMFESYNKGAA